jgi:hypothetical protein
MSEHANSPIDLGYEEVENLAPVQRLVRLILRQAVLDGADRIEFRLTSESSEVAFQMTVRTGGGETNLSPCPGSLFSPCMVVICNHASVPYYAKGRVNGSIRTVNPTSKWRLESDDLAQRVLLSKT